MPTKSNPGPTLPNARTVFSVAGPLKPAESLGCREVWTLHGPVILEQFPPPSREAQALQGQRRALGLSIGAAARKLGISVSNYSSLENGRLIPAPPTTWTFLELILKGGER